MNYIKELNAFYNQIVFNPLSGSAVALWNTLMHMNNACGWRKEFAAPASILELKSGIKGTSFKRAREELQAKGYIRVQSRGGNQAPIYQLISQWSEGQQEGHAVQSFFVSNENRNDQVPDNQTEHTSFPVADRTADRTTDQQMDDKTDETANRYIDHNTDSCPTINPGYNSAPLFKQKEKRNQTKLNETTTTTTDAIRFYQENFSVINAFVAEDIGMWMTDIGEPLVLHAMKRSLEQNKPTWRYVKAILKAWEAKNIRTVDQADAEDAAFQKQKKQAANQSDITRKEVVPNWFTKSKQKQAQTEQISKPKTPDPAETAREKEAFEKELAAFLGKTR